MYRLWTTLRHTFLNLRGQILGWGLGVAFLGLLLIPFYSIFNEQQGDFMQMIEAYPPEFLAFFGGDAQSLLTPGGFLGMYGFSMLPVIVPIFAVIAGSGLFAGDEERGRLDLILSHPVGRTAFFLGRFLAFSGATTAIMVLGWLGFVLPLANSEMDITWGQMALPFIQLWAQTILYGSLALFLSTFMPSRSLAATVSAIIMVASYLISSMAFMDESLERISNFLPYAYFQGAEAIQDFNLVWFLGLLGISFVLAGLAWWRFNRRDIRLSGEGSFGLSGLFFWRRGKVHG